MHEKSGLALALFAFLLTPLYGACDQMARVTAEPEPFVSNDPLFSYDSSTPLYPGEWHLVNQAPSSIQYPASTAPNGHNTAAATIQNYGLDMNVSPAWSRGYTGKGVIIGILDDGLEFSHPDLSIERELSAGFDSNGLVPGQDGSHSKDSDSHGTTVAGMAAAIGGNGIGVSGSAPHATVASEKVNNFTSIDDYHMHSHAIFWQAGLGWKDQMTTSEIMGLTSLLSAPIISIKNSSSKTALFKYPPRFPESYAAFARTAANGMLFAQAAGNCRRTRQQDVNVNLETTNPYVIGVAAAGSPGNFALYSSFGAAVSTSVLSESANWAVAGIPGDRAYANGFGVSSTDRLGSLGTNYQGNTASVFLPDISDLDYTGQFDGTSAATPILSGILALAKQANQNLNARMAKHLLARTSRVIDPNDKSDSSTWRFGKSRQSGWQKNKAGIRFNPNYGFGLANASALVEDALKSAYVTTETFHSSGLKNVNRAIPPSNAEGISSSIRVKVPPSKKQKLEGVEVYLKISGGDRSEWQVILEKEGTSSRLWTASNEIPNLPENPMFGDSTPSEGIDHAFLSNAFWGEDPDGVWKLYISNPSGTQNATIEQWGLVLHMGDIKYDVPGETILPRNTGTLGFSKNRKSSKFVIRKGNALRLAGNALVNGGRVQVDGRLEPLRMFEVSKLDTTMSSVTETLSYSRGVQVLISGGTLSGTGRIIAPVGVDGVGGVYNLAGTVRPGTARIGGTLHIGKSESSSTSYSQTNGLLAIDVLSTKNLGKLIVHGTASLGGTLYVTTQEKFAVQKGTRLRNVVRAEAINGEFSKVVSQIPGTRLHWKPIYGRNCVDLVAE